MRLLRLAALAAAIITFPSLIQNFVSIPDGLDWLLMDPATAFGLFISEVLWFSYFSDYRHSDKWLFWQAVVSLPITVLTVVDYFVTAHLPLIGIFTPDDDSFMINLAITFCAYYLIQISYRWLSRTLIFINGFLAIVLFVAVLSISGHIYRLSQDTISSQILVPIPGVAILSFVILALSIFIHANRMERLYLNRKIILSFLLMFIAILGANLVVYKNFNQTILVAEKINTTRHTLAEIYELDLLLDKIDSDAQSYELSGDTSRLQSYEANKLLYVETIEHVEVESLQSNNPAIRNSIAAIRGLGADILTTTDALILQKQRNPITPVIRQTADDRLDAYMDDMLDQVRDITTTYTDELNKLAIQEAYGGRGIIIGVSISSALSILLIIFTPLFIRQTIRELSMTEDKLKKSYRQINEEKSRAEAIVANIGDGLFTVGPDRQITLFNPTAENITGIQAANVVGKKFDEVLHFTAENGDKDQLEFVTKALNGTETQLSHNISLKHSSGRKLDVQITASPAKDRKGMVTAAIITFRDRTQEQALENAKDEFVALASHQLRTPATATKQFLAMFLQGYAGDITETQRKYLQEAYDNNELGINIIEELLNIARIESNQVKITKEQIDASQLVQRTADSHTSLAAKNNQTIVVKLPKEPVFLYGDISMVSMILDNLTTNAIKYTLEGGTITLALEKTGSHVRIHVSDTGIGMQKKDIPKIFGRFSRLEDPSKQHVSGTGIGLYLVQKIVDMHHAKINVQSVYGKGSTFTIDFNES